MNNVRIEVCVIGGGIVGLALARELAQRGRGVIVLEAAHVGERAAAGVAAGMIAPASEVDLADPRLTQLALVAHEEYGAWAAALEHDSGIEVGFDATGTLIVALHHDHLALMERLDAFQHARGLHTERLSAAQAREAEPYLSPAIIGALRTQDTQVNPRRLLRALPLALLHDGVSVLEGAEVTSALPDGDNYAVRFVRDGVEGVVEADQVVLAAGAWSSKIAFAKDVPALPMRPVKGQILRLRGERLIQHTVRTPDIYLVPRADGELVVGASMEEMGFDARPTAGVVDDLLNDARRVVPGIAELALEECGVGFRPALRDHLPAIGNLDGRGLFVATGHFRNGVELAPITARLLGDLMCDDRTDELLVPYNPARFVASAVRA